MCTTHGVLEDLELLTDAANAADDLLENYYRVQVAKALNPLKESDYKKIVTALAASLRKTNAKFEAAAMREALDALDVDWPNLTPTQIDRVITASSAALLPIPAQTLPIISDTLQATGTKTVKGVKVATSRRFRLDIGLTFNERDLAITKKLVTANTNFVTNEYGVRLQGYSTKARTIVGEGLDAGLDRYDIAARLDKEIPSALIGRNKNYWAVVSASYVNRSRVWGQLASYEDAGLDTFIFESVIDTRTTEVCRFMHGTEFPVKSGVSKYTEMDALAEPNDVKQSAPWVWQSRDDDGNSILAYRDANGDKQKVAQIDKPGIGVNDRIGTYSGGMTPSQLEAVGIMMPPLHGL